MSGYDVATPSSSHNYLDWRLDRKNVDQLSLANKRVSWNHYKLESESSCDSDDSSDSPRSIQGKETDLARDTSDLEWSSDESAASVIEYEVVSTDAELPEDKPSQFVDSNSSSGTSDDEIIATTVIHAMLNEGDFMFADSEDSMSAASTDSELSPFDYWNCAQCRNTNNNPMFRYCEKCYKVRKDFFPPRPKRKRPKCKRSKKQKHASGPVQYGGEPSEVRVVENRKRSIENEGDSAVKKVKRDICELSVIKKNLNNNIVLSDSYKAQSRIDIDITPINDTLSFSQPAFTNFECNVEPLTKTLSDPAIMFSKDDMDLISHKHFTDNECDIVKADISLLDQPKKKFVNLSKQSESDMCITCLVEPKSGVFVHGRIAHICCCYKCSVKVWIKTKRCPICNCKVSNVLKAFVM